MVFLREEFASFRDLIPDLQKGYRDRQLLEAVCAATDFPAFPHSCKGVFIQSEGV